MSIVLSQGFLVRDFFFAVPLMFRDQEREFLDASITMDSTPSQTKQDALVHENPFQVSSMIKNPEREKLLTL